MSAIKLGALALAGVALAVPNHGNNHAHFHHNKRHGPSSYGSSAEAPFPIANGTQPAYGPTGSLVTYTSTSTSYKTVTSTVQFGSAGTGYGTGASVGAAGYSTGCAEDVTVTTKIYETVTVTPGSSSSVVAPVETSSSSEASASSGTTTLSSSSSIASSESSSASAPSISLTYSEVAKGHSWKPAPTSYEAASSSSPSSSSTSTSEDVAPTTSSLSSYIAPTTSSLSSYVAPTTSSSSAASPSSTYSGSKGSGKRGVAYNDVTLTECFTDSDLISWGYNWNPQSWGLEGVTFIPTLHDTSDMFTKDWKTLAQTSVDNGDKTLFSFNEPDMSSQANLSPEDAAAAHQSWMKDLSDDAVIYAPSVTNGGQPGNNLGTDWLGKFIEACNGNCRINGINLHYYATDDTKQFTDYIQSVHEDERFQQYPIYISEFGVTQGDVGEFLKVVMPWLDAQDYVHGYAYFMVSEGLLNDGTAPSEYGSVYKDYTGSS